MCLYAYFIQEQFHCSSLFNVLWQGMHVAPYTYPFDFDAWSEESSVKQTNIGIVQTKLLFLHYYIIYVLYYSCMTCSYT